MTTQQPSTGRRRRSDGGTDGSDGSQRATGTAVDADPTEVLQLLGDEHTRQVLNAVASRPRSARDVTEVTDVSRVTAYRRLGRLERAGLVDSATVFDSNGNHHAQYRTTCDEVVVRFTPDGLELTVRGAGSGENPDDAD